MSLRSRIRRARIRGDLYDRAMRTVASVENADKSGRDQAHALIRKIHAEHPRDGRSCAVPNCCGEI